MARALYPSAEVCLLSRSTCTSKHGCPTFEKAHDPYGYICLERYGYINTSGVYLLPTSDVCGFRF